MGLFNLREDKMNRGHAFAVFFSLAIFIAPSLALADSANVHLERGKDWTSLKNYSRARKEFDAAINIDPRSKEARYEIAYTYFLQGDLIEAVKWLRKIQQFAPKYKQAAKLKDRIRLNGYELLAAGEPHAQAKGLRVTAATLSDSAVPYLKEMMGAEDQRNALEAAALLRRLTPEAVKRTWITLSEGGSGHVRFRAAKQLWDKERYKPAAKVLADKYGNDFLSASKWEASRAGDDLVDLGIKVAKLYLLQAVEHYKAYNYAVTQYAVEQLTAHKIKAVVPFLIDAINIELSGKHDANGCRGPNRKGLYKTYVNSLVALDAKESIPAIKVILSNTVTDSYNYTDCVDRYLANLAALDSQKWKEFDYWYHEGGRSQFNTVITKFNCFRDGKSLCGSLKADAIDPTSPNASKVRRLAKILGPCNIFGRCEEGYDLKIGYVVVRGPETVDYVANIENTERNKNAGKVVFALQATGNHERAWVIKDVKNLRITGTEKAIERNKRLVEYSARYGKGKDGIPPGSAAQVNGLTKSQTAKKDIRMLNSALKLYRLDNFQYPTEEQGLQALVIKPTSEPTPKNWKQGGYLSQLPDDPWGKPYHYDNPGEGGSVDITTYGADGRPGGEGPAADLSNDFTK